MTAYKPTISTMFYWVISVVGCVQVVFVGIRGSNVFSDIAIDYIIIRPQSCDYSPPCTCILCSTSSQILAAALVRKWLLANISVKPTCKYGSFSPASGCRLNLVIWLLLIEYVRTAWLTRCDQVTPRLNRERVLKPA